MNVYVLKIIRHYTNENIITLYYKHIGYLSIVTLVSNISNAAVFKTKKAANEVNKKLGNKYLVEALIR